MERRGQSVWGWLSLGAGAIGILLTTLMVVAVGMQGEDLDPESPQAQILGLLILAGIGMNVLGIILAVAGLVGDRRSGQVTLWLGLILSAAPCLCMGALIALGLAVMATGG